MYVSMYVCNVGVYSQTAIRDINEVVFSTILFMPSE